MLKFNASSQSYITVPANVMSNRRIFTIEAIFRTSTVATGDNWCHPTIWTTPGYGNGGYPNGKGDCGVNIKAGYLHYWSGIQHTGGGDEDVLTSNYVSDNKWYKIAFISDGSYLRLYLDKSQVGTTTAVGISTGNSYSTIGITKNLDNGAIQPYSPITMDLLYFRVTLEALQLDELYNGNLTKAICFYRDIVTADGKVKDLSGHGNHGTMNNIVVKRALTTFNNLKLSE